MAANQHLYKQKPSMRAAIAALVCALFIGSFFPVEGFAEVRRSDVVGNDTVEALGLSIAQCPNIDAQYAYLADETGTVYFQRDAQTPAQIASITKVMTAIVAIENAPLDLTVTVSANAARVGEASAGLLEGDTMDLTAALKALLVPSGNDAAVAIAESVGAYLIDQGLAHNEDPYAAFVAAMNEKATEIGCSDTLYENPHGLDDGEFAGNLHSTAEDQVKIGRYALSIDLIRSIVSGGSTIINVKRDGVVTPLELITTDELLERYDYTIGIKTGNTNLAGPCFSGAASNGEIELYAVVLKSTSEDQRFTDTQTLFEWAYDHLVDYPLANSDRQTTVVLNGEWQTVPIIAEATCADWTDKTVACTLSDPAASIRIFDLQGNISQSVSLKEVTGAVHVGDVVGTIEFKQHNTVLATYDLVACEEVEQPDLFQSVGIWWTRLTSGFFGQAEKADPVIYNTPKILVDKTGTAA